MKILRCCQLSKYFQVAHLVNTSELNVDVEILLVKRLKTGVEEGAHQGRLGLLDDVGTGVLGGLDSREGVELVHVHGVLGGELVAGASHELEFVGRDAEGGEDGLEEVRVVLDTVLENLHGRLVGIEEGVQVGQEDLDVDTSVQKVGDLHQRDAVRDVRTTRRGGTPVEPRSFSIGEDLADDVCAGDLLEVTGDALEAVLGLSGQRNSRSLVLLDLSELELSSRHFGVGRGLLEQVGRRYLVSRGRGNLLKLLLQGCCFRFAQDEQVALMVTPDKALQSPCPRRGRVSGPALNISIQAGA